MDFKFRMAVMTIQSLIKIAISSSASAVNIPPLSRAPVQFPFYKLSNSATEDMLTLTCCQDHILTEIYGLYVRKHHIVEMRGDVTDAGRTTKQTNN